MTVMINRLGSDETDVSPVGSALTHTAAPIVNQATTDYFVFPLSPQQVGFWRADCKLPGNPAYNGAFRHELTGPLDVALWEGAWNELVRRHEALRSTVRVVDGRPVLAIADASTLSLVAKDLRDLPQAARDAALEQLCIEDARYRFDLERGPLIRIGLIRLEDERYVQTMTLHHIVCDGWSIGILMDELPAIYAALVEGRPVPLAGLDIQFGDYLAWLQDHLEEPSVAQQKKYWVAKLEDYRRLDVAPDLPRPDPMSVASDIVSRTLPAALIARLKALGDEQGGTLFTTSLAGLLAFLWRETGREDLGVGTHVAGRDRLELEKLVGPLLNHIVIRTRGTAELSVRQLEAGAREALYEALANQDAPLEIVVEALAASGPAVPQPFFSVNFASYRAFAGGRNFTSNSAGVRLRTLPSKSQGALFDLFFFMIEREDGWRLSLDYRTQLFSEKRAWQLLDGFIAVLQQIGNRPDARLADLEFVPTELAVSWARDATVVTEPAALTADPQEPVQATGPAQEGPWVIPASHAQERLWLLSRAAPEATAFNMPAALRITGTLDAKLLESSIRHLIARHEILRTSFEEVDGTLSQVIAHEAPFNLLEAELDESGNADRDERIKQEIRRESSIAFDLSTGPLIRGRLVRLAPRDHLLVLTLHDIVADAQSLALMQSELWATYDALSEGREPALPELELQFGDFATWQREWVECEAARDQLDFWKRKLASPLPVLDFPLDRLSSHGPQKGVGLATEALSADLVDRLKRLAQTQSATMFVVTGAAFAMMLARHARQSEILFGSPMVNRTRDTEAMLGRFAGPMAIRLDLAGDPTLLDVVTRARDTTYEALGNAAYPFELLLEHIDARAIEGRNPLFQFYFLYQVAFLQAQRTKSFQIEPMQGLGIGTTFELQLAMIERPSGVVAQLEYNPSLLDPATVSAILAYYVYVLETLATDPAMKLSALREPEVTPANRTHRAELKARPSHVAPRSEIERGLVAIWERLLRQTGIGIHDDFFQLGGQSILAARLVVVIEKEYKVRTSISTLAWARTIEQLAGMLEAPEQNRSSLIVPLNAAREKQPLFLVHCGGGHVLRYQNFVSAMPGDQPILGISAPPIEEMDPGASVESLARRYIGELRKVRPKGPYRIGGYSFGGLVAYEMAAQLSSQGEQIDMLAIFDTANPAYYRVLPSHVRWKMRAIHIAQVLDGYLRLLLAGNFSRIAFRITDTSENYARRFGWKLRQLRGRLTGAPVQRDLKDFMSEFAVIGSRYAPPPLAGGVVLFYAEQRGWEYSGNRTLGWEGLVRDGVTVRYVPGDHESLMQAPHVEELARNFVAFTRDASAPTGPGKGG